jgi:hypothetical protein
MSHGFVAWNGSRLSIVLNIQHLECLVGFAPEDFELVKLGKVSQEPSKQSDVCLIVEKILVSHAIWQLVTLCLGELTSADTSVSHELIVDHLAQAALQVLHLIGNDSSVEDLQEGPLQLVHVKWVLA